MAGFLLVAVLTLADRLTKAWALLQPFREATALVPAALAFEPAVNPAGPLGLPVPAALLVVSAFVLGAVVLAAAWTEPDAFNRTLLAGVALGVASNAYDRLWLGHVVETFRLAGGLSFNLADVLIVVGVAGVLVRQRVRPELGPGRA